MAWNGIVGRGFSPPDFDRYLRTLKFGAWRPQFVVLHNTAVPTIASWHDVSGGQHMRGLESYYRDTLGWHAGPHLFVADDFIWVFSPLTLSGVHSPSWNLLSWGVEMVGDYSAEAFESGAGAQVAHNTVCALASLHAAAGLDSHTLRLHKEDPMTTHKGCPGSNVDKQAMIDRVHALLVRQYSGEHPLLAA